MLFFHLIVAFLCQATSLVFAADTAAWKSRSIYFVLTDRIARSSSDTGGSACGNLGNYCGGTVSSAFRIELDVAMLIITVSSQVSNQSSTTSRGRVLTPSGLLLWLQVRTLLSNASSTTDEFRQRWRVPWLLGSRPVCSELEPRQCCRAQEPC
jgi:hypothetical protein